MSNSGSTLKTILIIVGIFVFLFFLLIGVGLYSVVSGDGSDEEGYTENLSSSGQKVAVIEINSEIVTSDAVVKQVKEFTESSTVKALVVRVNSPGGGVAASQEMYEIIKKFRETNRPVVVSMGGVAASGGYYLSLGGTKIMANPGTLTGSIGVIMQLTQLKPLMDKVGVDIVTIKSGKFKDSGSPFRGMNEEEKKYFQGVIDDTYQQFVEAVSKERNLSKDKVLDLAQGQVYTGKQALAVGLVDTLGTYEEAISYAATLAGISGKPRIVKRKKTVTFMERILGKEETESLSNIREMFTNKPLLQYRMVQ